MDRDLRYCIETESRGPCLLRPRRTNHAVAQLLRGSRPHRGSVPKYWWKTAELYQLFLCLLGVQQLTEESAGCPYHERFCDIGSTVY